jgi:hypothetical protein
MIPTPIVEDKWLGGCGDSFCWASCDSPDCKSEYRLGDTPSKHWLRVALNEIEGVEDMRATIQELDSKQPNGT